MLVPECSYAAVWFATCAVHLQWNYMMCSMIHRPGVLLYCWTTCGLCGSQAEELRPRLWFTQGNYRWTVFGAAIYTVRAQYSYSYTPSYVARVLIDWDRTAKIAVDKPSAFESSYPFTYLICNYYYTIFTQINFLWNDFVTTVITRFAIYIMIHDKNIQYIWFDYVL